MEVCLEPLDEWVSRNKFNLALDIACHLSQYVEDKDDRETLLRLIMISIREDHERTKELFEKEQEALKELAFEAAKKRGW